MFSIVIPLYNKQDSIQQTIDSVLKQTFTHFELIVVDDGSVDNSFKIVSLIEDRRIILIHQENKGVCAARNKGIEVAQHQYIAFLDGDDVWTPDYLQEQVNLISDFPLAALWGVNFSPLSKGQTVCLLTGLPNGYRGYVENYFKLKRVSDLFCSSSVVVKKEAFDKAGLFDERIKYSEDIDMWYRIILNFPVVFYDKVMVLYRQDAENRALMKIPELKYFLPYFIDKYQIYKDQKDFYVFINKWSAVIIRKYYFNIKWERAYAKTAAQKLDYSLLPLVYRLLYKTPYVIGKAVYKIAELKKNILR